MRLGISSVTPFAIVTRTPKEVRNLKWRVRISFVSFPIWASFDVCIQNLRTRRSALLSSGRFRFQAAEDFLDKSGGILRCQDDGAIF